MALTKLPYPPLIREGFKKFRKEMLAIDLEKRGRELYNLPFSEFMKVYPAEVKQWWDNYGPSNWGATSEDTAAAVGIREMQEHGARESRGRSLHLARRPGRNHQEVGGDPAAAIR